MAPERRRGRSLATARVVPPSPGPLAGAAPGATDERLAAIGRVAAGVAHDLNNVLTVITLCTELLAAQAELDEAGHQRLDQIRRETQRGASMVWQILDFAHRGPMAQTPVDLDAFIGELVPVLQHMQAPEVSITFDADDAPHVVMGDAARLEQILSNLATNAADAIAGPGRIDITLESPEERWVRVRFSDTGAGIPPEVLPQIFEPFFSTKPPGRGTGLGLAQVQDLVFHHGGRVTVWSVLGEGTTVEIWIPALGGPGAGDGSGDRAAHGDVGADAGDVELLADHLEPGPAVEAHRAHAGVAPQFGAPGAGHVLDAGGEQGGPEAGAPHVGVGGHTPEPPAAGGAARPVLLVEGGDADEAVAVEGAEVHAGVVAGVARLQERLARPQHTVA